MSEPPIVPRRPKKSNPSKDYSSQETSSGEESRHLEETVESQSQLIETEREIQGVESLEEVPEIDRSKPNPPIPNRPKRSQSPIQKSEIDRDIEIIATSEPKAGVESKVETSDKANDQESKLIAELDTPHNSSDDLLDINGDGDKTPGNSSTKITFKDEDVDSGAPAEDSSSFNDDLETVSQDLEDPEPLEPSTGVNVDSQASTAHSMQMSASREHDKKSLEASSNSTQNSLGSDNQKKQSGSDIFNATEDLQKITSTQSTDAGSVGLTAPNRELNVEVSDDVPQAEEVLSKKKSAPSIPSRPKRREQSQMIDEETRIAEAQTPQIPIRPPKKRIEAKREEKHGDLDDEKPQVKAPPPKPKKMSSKIAAFQQMFSQAPLPLPSPSAQITTSAGKGGAPSSTKLSSDKMKFAANLQSMYGKGIAMPGMVNPHTANFTTDERASSGSSSEEVKAEPKQSSEKRTRGPRGKRLPKSLKDPIKIESKTRFDLVTGEVWSLRTSNSSVGISNNEENLPEPPRSARSTSSDLDLTLDESFTVAENEVQNVVEAQSNDQSLNEVVDSEPVQDSILTYKEESQDSELSQI